MTRTVSAADLKGWIQDGDELALLDVREEGVFARAHLLFAVCIPLSRLELRVRALVPRLSTRMVLCDADDGAEGLAQGAAGRLAGFGYGDISILEDGIEGWRKAGFELFGGINVPSKAFGEFVEHESGTASVSADELKAMMDKGENLIVMDSRPLPEYRRMSIPTGIDCPGAELAYRVHDMVPDPDTLVVVNCAGRTRSIIGAQSLINAGIPNRVVALRNGTMGWSLAGHELETGAERRAPEISAEGLAAAKAVAARVAERYGVRTMDAAGLETWRGETDKRTLFLLDVRNPEEYAAGHVAGSISAPGGQLVQATDRYVGAQGARLVLIDDTGVRATMTASWLIQLGWRDVAVLDDGLAGELETGTPPPPVPETGAVDGIGAPELKRIIEAGEAVVVDFATSLEYRAGHIPGAWFAVRSRLEDGLARIGPAPCLVFTSPDGVLAGLAAADAAALTDIPVKLLDGGTAGWRAAGLALAEGLENLASETDDLFYRAYDYGPEENIPARMQEYLDWETGLVEQIERDGTTRFRRFPG